jgi:hypothetical protein
VQGSQNLTFHFTRVTATEAGFRQNELDLLLELVQ